MATRHPLKYLLILFFLQPCISGLQAQDDPYRFMFAPDVWYNNVDGVRLGVRTLGEVEGTFKDGPHRLDAGVWLSTFLPDLPVSYYVSFTEPIPQISNFGNEGSIQLISSIRTGYSHHRIQFNKRWQPGFDEYKYKEVSVYYSTERLFDDEYRPFNKLWQDNWKNLFGISFKMSETLDFGLFEAYADATTNVNETSGAFTVATFEVLQSSELSDQFIWRIRGFAGIGSDNVAPEYRFMASMRPAQYWLNNGLSRSAGTIPQPWMESGSFQIAGGANLRGYSNRDIELLGTLQQSDNNLYFPLYRSFWSLNTEIEFPNPLNTALQNISIIGDLAELRSYLFVDGGMGTGRTLMTGTQNVAPQELITEPGFIADAGIGLQISFNIPDYLGKDRGIFIRYDVPFWLSDPLPRENSFSYRHVIGLGAVISL